MFIVPKLRNPSLEEQILTLGKMLIAFLSGWKWVIFIGDRISAYHLATLRGRAARTLPRGVPYLLGGNMGFTSFTAVLRKLKDIDSKNLIFLLLDTIVSPIPSLLLWKKCCLLILLIVKEVRKWFIFCLSRNCYKFTSVQSSAKLVL